MYVHAIENESVSGIYNAVAPNPVSQKTIAKTISKVKGGLVLPVPSISLKLILGEMSNVVLNSHNCSADRIIESGFTFEFEDVETAILDLNKA